MAWGSAPGTDGEGQTARVTWVSAVTFFLSMTFSASEKFHPEVFCRARCPDCKLIEIWFQLRTQTKGHHHCHYIEVITSTKCNATVSACLDNNKAVYSFSLLLEFFTCMRFIYKIRSTYQLPSIEVKLDAHVSNTFTVCSQVLS